MATPAGAHVGGSRTRGSGADEGVRPTNQEVAGQLQ